MSSAKLKCTTAKTIEKAKKLKIKTNVKNTVELRVIINGKIS
jgi:hypothetical protein